jgi:hypothetical protein
MRQLKSLETSIKEGTALFYNNTYPEPNTGCWLYAGNTTGNHGYGFIQAGGKYGYGLSAHRFSYLLHKGEILDNLLVCHSCDNRACVNPDHLFLGTHQDNTNDMRNKGRMSVGEKHPISKLKEADIPKIRELFSTGLYTKTSLAAMFGVTRSAIYKIVNGVTWKQTNTIV